MTRIPPPLLGYNNNVRYLGRTFHIQTEDSGTKYGRIMTHLFVDGGRIVKSTRTEYGSVIGQPGMTETVRRMMKDQHKNMFLALRAGEFDEIIERVTSGAAVSNAPEPAISRVPQLRTNASLPPLSFAAGEEPRTLPGMSTLVIDRSVAATSSNPSGDANETGLAGKRPSTLPRKDRSSIPPASRRASAAPAAATERTSVKTRVGGERISIKPTGVPSEQRIAAASALSAARRSNRPPSEPALIRPAANSSARIPIKPGRGLSEELSARPMGASSGRIPLKAGVSAASEHLVSKPPLAASSERIPLKSSPQKDRPSERPSRRLVVRPPTQTQEAIDPRSQSIFGEATAGKQTLDEVILSFLEDEES
ncbi:MAG: hypothetical protein ACM3ZE_21990 [Myxococcales bacterium]